MAKPGLRLRGTQRLKDNLQTIAKKYPQAAKKALFMEGERMRTIAIPLTPLDEVPLRQEAFVNSPVRTARGFSVTIGYGGAAAAYALSQHEGPGSTFAPPSWKGKRKLTYSEPGTGPKYLERAEIELSKDHLQQLQRIIIREAARINLK